MSEKRDGQLVSLTKLYRIRDLRTRVQRFSTSDRSLQSVCALVVVLLITAIGISLALQGWRSRILAFDMIDFLDGAHNLLTRGMLPQYGDVSSYASFTPPGVAWLMAPGMLVFNDPRLFEKVGSGFLHFGTLLGIFVLARAYFGTWCACVSVLLYGLSGIGLSFTGSLWAIGHPFFYVWMVYLVDQWVTHKDAKYLAAGIVTYAAGMYMDMAIAPALFILPATWLLYRPPLRLRPLFVAGTLALLIWYPYLQFEAGRAFVDLKSLVQLRSLLPDNYKNAWCDSSLTLRTWPNTSSTRASDFAQPQTPPNNTPDLLRPLLVRGKAILDGSLANFEEVASVTGTSVALLLLLLSALVVLTVLGLPPRSVELITRNGLWRYWLTPFAVAVIVFSVLVNEVIIARYFGEDVALRASAITSIRTLQAILLLTGIALLMRRQLAAIVTRPAISAGVNIQTTEHVERATLLPLSLLVPWLILLLIAEPGRSERFLWLWPLQVVVLAAFVTYALPRLRVPRPVTWLGQLLLIVVLVGSPLASKVHSSYRTSWSGSDAAEIDVADYIAEQIRSEGHDRAAIGYHIFIYPFMATYNIINPQYKVGAEFDLWFKYRHDIANTNQCAEGVSAGDEYRIVQMRPKSGREEPRHYFEASLDKDYRLLRRFDLYQVFKRGEGLHSDMMLSRTRDSRGQRHPATNSRYQ
jgi:hypothetical protein